MTQNYEPVLELIHQHSSQRHRNSTASLKRMLKACQKLGFSERETRNQLRAAEYTSNFRDDVDKPYNLAWVPIIEQHMEKHHAQDSKS